MVVVWWSRGVLQRFAEDRMALLPSLLVLLEMADREVGPDWVPDLPEGLAPSPKSFRFLEVR